MLVTLIGVEGGAGVEVGAVLALALTDPEELDVLDDDLHPESAIISTEIIVRDNRSFIFIAPCINCL